MNYAIYCRKSTESEDRQVLSLDAQVESCRELLQRLPDSASLEAPIRESRSAKQEGRPGFGELLKAVEDGRVQGIIAWHPDRLARNAMDGARILDLLNRGLLKSLQFVTFNFDNTPEGRLFLFLLFGQATHYSESLSRSVRRGIDAKLRTGWKPGPAPLGYRNCAKTRTTPPDPKRFPLIQRALKLAAAGTHRPKEIQRVINGEWAFRTPVRKRRGGRPLCLSALHRMLRNPFYAGLISWKGATYPGKHKPMISPREHALILARLGGRSASRPKSREFAYRGLMTCGECGRPITAELKTNRHGSKYTYYRCTKTRRDYRCRQPVIQERELELQFEAFLARVALPEEFAVIVKRRLRRQASSARTREAAVAADREALLSRLDRKLSRLTDLSLDEQISDEEYQSKREQILEEKEALATASSQESSDWFEPAIATVDFSVHAVSCFRHASPRQRRLIIEIVGSNPVLQDRKLTIHAAKPFVHAGQAPTDSQLRRFEEDVRTLGDAGKLRSIADALSRLTAPHSEGSGWTTNDGGRPTD